MMKSSLVTLKLAKAGAVDGPIKKRNLAQIKTAICSPDLFFFFFSSDFLMASPRLIKKKRRSCSGSGGGSAWV